MLKGTGRGRPLDEHIMKLRFSHRCTFLLAPILLGLNKSTVIINEILGGIPCNGNEQKVVFIREMIQKTQHHERPADERKKLGLHRRK